MTSDPATCAAMAENPRRHRRLDRELVALLARRAAWIDRAVVVKPDERLPARIGARVEEVIANVRAEADAAGLDPALAEALWRRIVDWSIAREERALEGSPVTAEIIDGKAFAAGLRARDRRRGRAAQGASTASAGPRGGPRRRRSGEPDLRAQQGQADRARPACTPRAPLPADDHRGRAARAGRPLNADPTSTASSCSCRCRKQIDAQRVLDAIDPDKDVDGFHVVTSAGSRLGQPALRPLHAARLPDAARATGSATSPGARPSSSAARTSSASRWRSCCSRENAR